MDRFQNSEPRQGEDTPTAPVQLEVLAGPVHQGKKKNHTHIMEKEEMKLSL